MKAATNYLMDGQGNIVISIHAAREGGDNMPYMYNQAQHISIHAAREGGDENGFTAMQETDISIHAAREGGDLPLLLPQQLRHYFNPRRP